MYTVYILENPSRHYYIRQTLNLKDQLQRHNSGLSRYTRGRGPWNLEYREEHATRKAACRRERELKGWQRADRLRRLIVG